WPQSIPLSHFLDFSFFCQNFFQIFFRFCGPPRGPERAPRVGLRLRQVNHYLAPIVNDGRAKGYRVTGFSSTEHGIRVDSLTPKFVQLTGRVARKRLLASMTHHW